MERCRVSLMSLWAPTEFDIPGNMVWAALFYAVVGSLLTLLLGAPMVDINVRRNQAEADHRFALIRMRENSEGIALIRGAADEDRHPPRRLRARRLRDEGALRAGADADVP
jgi:putative ATP-binding cassette transporter